jgi:hypothetical protein
MIMIRMLSILFALVVLSGCAALPQSIGTCVEPQRVRSVNITYQQQINMVKVQVAPHRVEANSGDLIRFKINGTLGKLVSVKGKATDPDAAWIVGNATAGSFYVCVPMIAEPTQLFSYEVDVDGIGFLDPEVRVRR